MKLERGGRRSVLCFFVGCLHCLGLGKCRKRSRSRLLLPKPELLSRKNPNSVSGAPKPCKSLAPYKPYTLPKFYINLSPSQVFRSRGAGRGYPCRPATPTCNRHFLHAGHDADSGQTQKAKPPKRKAQLRKQLSRDSGMRTANW